MVEPRMLITLQGWVAAQKPTPANNTTTIRYTMTAPASTNWMAKDFDDSAWTKTEDAASIPAAVPKDGEVWIRIRCELPGELINNTYAKVKGTMQMDTPARSRTRTASGGRRYGNGVETFLTGSGSPASTLPLTAPFSLPERLFRIKAMRNTYRRLFLIPRASSPLTWVSTQSKLLLMAPNKDRAATLGFRCVVDAAE